MKLKLVEKKKAAKDTLEFLFEPEREVNWLPGQFFYWNLPKLTHPDPKGATRHFTIHHSPTEGKLIGFTTRIRTDSGFKQTIKELEIGAELQGEGPEGTFILDENEKGNHVLLAGGIGITPFRSFIKYNIDRGLKDIGIHLIYANSTPSEIVFKKELESWTKQANNIKVSLTITKPEESQEKWTGLTGRIDENMIKNQISDYDLKSTTFWLCGPPLMVEAMQKVTGALGISSGKVREEKFTGY